jgi:hypothetical protein
MCRDWEEPEWKPAVVSAPDGDADSAHYRPPRQTSWSKALVRHGADARVALADVLGVPATIFVLSPRVSDPLAAYDPEARRGTTKFSMCR